jgi:hypothetical protein
MLNELLARKLGKRAGMDRLPVAQNGYAIPD